MGEVITGEEGLVGRLVRGGGVILFGLGVRCAVSVRGLGTSFGNQTK